ncbi:unnamed protein product [Ixodes hexagonus]
MPEDVVLVKRYVDDILVCSKGSGLLPKIRDVVTSAAPEMVFTAEEPVGGVMQYLDLRLYVHGGLCWEYGKVTPKPLLPFKSCHSKLVKRGIVMSLLDAALKKSCPHKGPVSIRNQLLRLKHAGYNNNIVKGVAMRLLMKIGGMKKGQIAKLDKVVCVPFFHGFSHNLMSIARRFNVKVLFTTDFKLSKLTPFVGGQHGCQKKHRDASVDCRESVVYDIPMSCGFSYVGQTKRCVNDRLNEHKRAVKNNAANSEIAKHIQECNNCVAEWDGTLVLSEERNCIKRVLKETIRISLVGNCISQPSMTLDVATKKFLRV